MCWKILEILGAGASTLLLLISSEKALAQREKLTRKGPGLFRKPMCTGCRGRPNRHQCKWSLRLCSNLYTDIPDNLRHLCRTLRPLQTALAGAHKACHMNGGVDYFHAAVYIANMLYLSTSRHRWCCLPGMNLPMSR